MNTKVLIAAPLRQDVDVFLEYQEALDKLIIPGGVTVDRYFVVNDCPEVIPYIKGDYDVCDTGDKYEKCVNDHCWSQDNLDKMPQLRNMTIKRCLDGYYDYLFSIDTDVIVQPETLVTLLETGKSIVSEIFWTNGWCNAWMYDQSGGMSQGWHEPGLYQVGMTGACTLMKEFVFRRGVNYSRIPNILNVLRGEDRWFSIRAACAGVEMWLDTHYPATHLFTRDEYAEYMRRKNIGN